MYIDQYGMTNSRTDETNAENSMLWTLQHIILERKAGRHASSEARLEDLKTAIRNCRVGQGLYMQNPSHVTIPPKTGKDAYMSPDQLIMFMMTSRYHGMDVHKEIMKKIVKQGLFRYNNLEDKKLRLIHPRDLVLYISMNVSLLGNLLLPILAIACIASCFSKREITSGKLLAWIKIQMLQEEFIVMKLCGKVCDILIKRTHGTWADVFKIYFPRPHHPIAKLAKEVYGV